MAISKRSNNTGASGGNGMQTFSVPYLQACEIHHEYKGGHVVPCSNCGEEYTLEPQHTFRESVELVLVLKSNGCPYCNNKKPLSAEHLQWFQENKNKVMTLEFPVLRDGEVRLIRVYRKPQNFKAINKTKLKAALKEQAEKLEQKQNEANAEKLANILAQVNG